MLMNRDGDSPKAGKVLIQSAGQPLWRAVSCLSDYIDTRNARADILIHLLPQVVEVRDVDGFCDSMRALGGEVWSRDAWPGTAGEWAAVERHFPPFHIGRFQVTYMWSAYVKLLEYRGGSVSFDLMKCEASVSFGSDRMNGGGFSSAFDKGGTVTAGQVCAWAAPYVREEEGLDMPPEYLNDDTVLWPVAPYADIRPPELVRPVHQKPVLQKPTPQKPAPKAQGETKDRYGRSEAAALRDASMRREKAAQLEAKVRIRLFNALLPFLDRHADPDDWDACAEQILRYFGFEDGNYCQLSKELYCQVTPDEVAFTRHWESHSFFDDGNGIEGHERRWIAWAPPGADADPFRDDGRPHRYTIHGAPVRRGEYRENPFGLKGRYGFFYEKLEEATS